MRKRGLGCIINPKVVGKTFASLMKIDGRQFSKGKKTLQFNSEAGGQDERKRKIVKGSVKNPIKLPKIAEK